MSKRVLQPLALILAAVALPMALFLYLRLNVAADPLYPAPHGHFYIVSGAALLAAVLAIIVGVAGARLRNISVTFLSMAFSSLALVFLLHGLATPGFLLPVTQVPGIAAQLSILLAAWWLYLSSCPTDHPVVRTLARRQTWLVPAWVGLMIIALLVGLAYPQAVRFIPIHLSPLKWIATFVVVVLAAAAARHYWVAYRYARFPLQIAILISTGWMVDSQIIIVTSDLFRASWWIYHFLLLGAMLATLYGLVRQYAMGASVAMAVKGLMGLDPVERIEAGIAPSIRALVIATETRDTYTAGHSYRVTIEALRLGQAMRIPPEQLRALVQGGILHDIGKIEVPDQILNKPGQLTAAERAVVERHPVTGYEVCRRLGFRQEELGIIRHHHEKWDGTGYPDRLAGTQIPLLARILAVADVYDAVTSNRSYRRPWTHEQAADLIRREAGRHFDPECVAAWLRIDRTAIAGERYPAWMQVAPALEQGAAGSQ